MGCIWLLWFLPWNVVTWPLPLSVLLVMLERRSVAFNFDHKWPKKSRGEGMDMDDVSYDVSNGRIHEWKSSSVRPFSSDENQSLQQSQNTLQVFFSNWSLLRIVDMISGKSWECNQRLPLSSHSCNTRRKHKQAITIASHYGNSLIYYSNRKRWERRIERNRSQQLQTTNQY